MAIAKEYYGNYTALIGTRAEVMGALTGKGYDTVVFSYYDVGASLLVAICKAGLLA